MNEIEIEIDEKTGVPKHTLSALSHYVNLGIPTGGFLRSVLSNDLMGSFARADDFNLKAMKEIVSYIYNELPSNCHGSADRYLDWLAIFRDNRS